MKALKYIAILAMMFSIHAAHAACIGQETTVVFINGVWTTDREAIAHKDALELSAREKGLSPSCVHFDYSHTQDDTKSRDIAEALIQKSNELSVPLLTMVRAFFALFVLDAQMTLAIDDVLVSGYQDTITIIDTQLDKHLQKFREASLNLGRRGVAITHSQGGLYGNVMWNMFTPIEQTNTRLVTVSNPSSGAVDGGPNTRLSRDGVANRFFLAASLSGLIPNTDRPCDTEAETSQNSWPCHGFETGYLHDTEARAQIVSDIKASLPTAAIQGTVRDFTGGSSFVSGAVVSLFSDSTFIAETLASATGTYRFDNIPAPCPSCFVKAKSPAVDACGTTSTPVIAGEVKAADIVLSGSCDIPLPVFMYEKPRTESFWFRRLTLGLSVSDGLGSLYTPAGNQTVNQVSFYLWREGTPGGVLEARIYAEDGTLLAISAPVDGNTVILSPNWFPPNGNEGGWVVFAFGTPVPLVFGNRYVLTVHDVENRQIYILGTSYNAGFSSENICVFRQDFLPFTLSGCNGGVLWGESANMRIE